MANQDQILLQTKLNTPLVTSDLVVRARLFEQLERGVNRPLTLVCAPAGFGKTTLVCTWLERRAADRSSAPDFPPAAWLSLDKNDSDLNLFLRYFVTALRTIFQDACPETLALLQAPQPAPQAVLYATFSNELNVLPGEAILVLDDYQFIRGKAVLNLLIELARHWPKPLHLVLISRIDPPLPLASLRAKGMLHEIRAQELRFTPEETAVYLNKAQLASPLSQNYLPLLRESFEGWPAGLHLVTLSLRSAGSQEAVLSALSGENPNIARYLVDEVLTHQVPAIQTFLLKTSILDRFSAPLCEAILGKMDAPWNVRACLDWIERSDLFITPLDDRREWYRYHHLFQELLQQRLSTDFPPALETKLHRLASTWLEEHGLFDEALQHALAAGDLDLVAHQMTAGLRDVINREDRQTLERWLRLLPEEVIQRQPGLLIIKAWALQFSWKLDLQAQVLKQIEDLLDAGGGASLPADDLQLLRAQVLLLKAQQAYFGNQPMRAIDFCRQALALLPLSWTFGRGAGMFFLGFSMQASGQAQAAERLLLVEYESSADKADSYSQFLMFSLCFNYLNSGQLEQASRSAQVLIQAATRSRIAIMKNWGDWFLGVTHYQRNELEAAVQYFSQIFENHYIAQISAWRDAGAGLALIHQIQGESAKALQMVETISQFDLAQRGSEDRRTSSLRAKMHFLQGDLEKADRWIEIFTDPPPDQPLLWLEEPQVTRARLLLARGADGDLRLTLQILAALDDITERTHNTRYKTEILALRALVLEAQGESSQADAELKQAVDLSRSGGFIRVFVDLGKPMQEMMSRLFGQGYLVVTIRRILDAFPQDEHNLAGGDVPAPLAPHLSLGNTMLVDPLTPRELEVLALLRGPLSIKEIAQQLNISHATARRHTINIYGKLGVNQRWNAVTRAEELGILPPR